MKVLLWEIKRESYRCAKVSWFLYKYFGIKRKHPCGRSKKDDYMCCCLPMNLENSTVINEGKIHKVVCKVCGTTHMDSNCYIDPKMKRNVKK